MIRLSLLLCVVVFQSQVFSQISGQVFNQEGKTGLAGSTVIVVRMRDSMLLKSVITAKNGSFSITGLPLRDSLILTVTNVGFTQFSGLLFLKDKQFVMEPVLLEPLSAVLNEVVVSVKRPLAIIKEDTIEYRASSFKTPPNSKAGDIIKRIPGLMIDESGRLSYNGRPISKILVNGQVFFGENGQVALQNIPVDLIDKIQISDARTAEEREVSLSRNADEHSLNIKLKSDQVFMGSATASVGTDRRYDFSGFASRSNGRQRISLIGGANNINRVGNFPGNNPIVIATSNGGGIIESWGGSIDFADRLTKQTNIEASYRFNRPITTRESLQERKHSVLQDSVLYNNSSSLVLNKQEQHELNIRVFCSKKFTVWQRIGYDITQNSITRTYSTMINNSLLLNNQQSRYLSDGSRWNSASGFFLNVVEKFRHSFRITGQIRLEDSKLNDVNQANTQFYKLGVPDSMAKINQEIRKVQADRSANASLHYQYAIDTSWKVIIVQQLEQKWNRADKSTFNVLNGTKARDSLYSNSFRSDGLQFLSTASIRYYFKHVELIGGAQLLINHIERKNLDIKNSASQNLVKILPQFILSNGTLSKGFFHLKYSLSYEFPSVEQVQPVADNTNPLFQKLGNPDLVPQGNHQISAYFIKLRPGKRLDGLNAGLSFRPVQNKIASFLVNDSLGRQYLQYTNVSGTYSIGGDLSTTLVYAIGRGRLTLQTFLAGDYSYDKNFLNYEPIFTSTFSAGPKAQVKYQKEDLASLEISYYPSINHIRYSQNNSADQQYWVQNISGNFELFLFKRIKWNNAIAFTYNDQLPSNFDRSSLLWNMNATIVCLKKKKGEIRVSAFDILKQNRNLVRTIGDNFIEDSQANNLQRYFMLGFTYNFSGIRQK